MDDYLRRIRNMGVMPATVIDVGVGYGTIDLYNWSESTRFLLVEPMAEFEKSLRAISKKVDAVYEIAAAGAEDGEIEIFFNADLQGASLLPGQNEKRVVQQKTLDSLVRIHKLEPPYLLKVDTQGWEFSVLAGAGETLKKTEIVILETPLFDFANNGLTLPETIRKMEVLGFVPHDIFDGLLRPFDNALGQVDIAFVRADSALRESHVWANDKQSAAKGRLHRLRRFIGV